MGTLSRGLANVERLLHDKVMDGMSGAEVEAEQLHRCQPPGVEDLGLLDDIGVLAKAWQFAGKEQQGLQIEWEDTECGPLIKGSLATIECSPWKEYEGGDHVLFVGEVQNYHYEEGNSLVFFQGKFLETNSIDIYVKK